MTAPAWLTARPIAHRGLHDRASGRIENSLGAALAAVAGGFAIECDVQPSAEGEAMVFHDHDLDRLTGLTGPITARSAAELARVTLAGSRDTICPLPAFLAAIGDRVPVIIEIKSRFDGDLTLARRVVEVAQAAGCRVAVKSFDPAVVAAVRELAPALPRGIVAQSAYDGPGWRHLGPALKDALAHLRHVQATRPHFLSWRVGDLPVAEAVHRRSRDTPIMAWTVRGESDRRRAVAHADQIVFEGFRPES